MKRWIERYEELSKIENLKHFYRLRIQLDENIILDDYLAFDKMDKIFETWLDDNQTLLDNICDELMKCDLKNEH